MQPVEREDPPGIGRPPAQRAEADRPSGLQPHGKEALAVRSEQGPRGEIGADPGRCGVVAGTGVGGLWTQEVEEKVLFERGPSRVSPFLVPMMMANATAGTIAMRHLSGA